MTMMVFERIKKRKQLKAIKNYILRLPKILGTDYGFSPTYTGEQVTRAIEGNKLDSKYQSYATAMFCSPEEFGRFHQKSGKLMDRKWLRREIARCYFGDCTGVYGDFTYSDIVHHSVCHGHGVTFADSFGHGHHGGGGHGGADHGGDGHGGDGH